MRSLARKINLSLMLIMFITLLILSFNFDSYQVKLISFKFSLLLFFVIIQIPGLLRQNSNYTSIIIFAVNLFFAFIMFASIFSIYEKISAWLYISFCSISLFSKYKFNG